MAHPPPLRFLSAWFCPFAHRAHIALEHLGISYNYVEALGWIEKDGIYHHTKTAELVASNPLGTVPSLIDAKGRCVHESLVCVEFASDLAAQQQCTRPLLLSRDPFERASQRVEADFVNRRLCSPYYSILVRESPEERRAHFDDLLVSLKEFSGRIKGPFVGGGELSLVDCTLFPHAYRYYVLETYRGFVVPRTPDFAPFHGWLEHMQSVPAVARTLPDRAKYLQHAEKYASGRARSKVAQAVRAGRAAHDMK